MLAQKSLLKHTNTTAKCALALPLVCIGNDKILLFNHFIASIRVFL